MADFGEQFRDKTINVPLEDAPQAFYALGRLRGFKDGKRRGWSEGWAERRRYDERSLPGIVMMWIGIGASLGMVFQEAGVIAHALIVAVGILWGMWDDIRWWRK